MLITGFGIFFRYFGYFAYFDTPLVYLVLAYFFTYLFIENLPLTEWTIKVRSDINSVEIHTQLSHKGIQWMVCWWVLVHSGPLGEAAISWPTQCGGEILLDKLPSTSTKKHCISDAFRNASGPELSWLNK
jgi:hypothetical protein